MMKEFLYHNLQRRIITLILIVSFAPLIILGATLYYQFESTYRQNIDEQIKERTAILNAMADTHIFEEMIDEGSLSRIFEVMNSRAGAFVDLGVIDNQGLHRAYVGPYNLKGHNYINEPWFNEVMSKGVYKSDVYMGFRKMPHFVIAVRRHDNENPWILRATIDPDILEEIVRSAQIGRTGDAFLINRDGVYQTRPRFHGQVLSQSTLDTSLFGGRVTVTEITGGKNRTSLYAGSWLKDKNWLLVIKQEPDELMSRLFEIRYMEIIIISMGILAIVITTFFATRLAIRQLKNSDEKNGWTQRPVDAVGQIGGPGQDGRRRSARDQ